MDEIEIHKGSEPTDIINTCWFQWGCTLKMVSEIFTIESNFYGPFKTKNSHRNMNCETRKVMIRPIGNGVLRKFVLTIKLKSVNVKVN